MLSIVLLGVSVMLILLLTVKWQVHPFLSLLAAAFFFAVGSGMPLDSIPALVNSGFGNTLGNIGIVIVLGVIIGAFLEHTGGAFKLADVVLRLIGRQRVHEAMGVVGFVVSIPVFADSGFVILNALNKSLTKAAGLSIAGTATVLFLGLLITHVLVPPTPGPIAAAGIIGADVGLVMGVGLVIGLLALVVAIVYCKTIAARTWIDPNPDITEAQIAEKIAQAPGALKSFLPILVPIVLIVGKSVLDFSLPEGAEPATLVTVIRFIGTPMIALLIGMGFAFLLPRAWDTHMLSAGGWVGKALASASNILLITGAGGVFGAILQNSGIADSMADLLAGTNLGIWLPFLLAAAIKTAQGSSTVALVTTASIVAPLLAAMGFTGELDKALVVAAIGAGSLVVSHANDSGFWVVTQLSGIDVETGYRVYTVGTLVTGASAGLLVFAASLVF